MGKLIIVENDKVEGTDKHNVSGPGTAGSSPATYVGVGDFTYVGKMTDQLSDFVKIAGKPVALKSSKSSLNHGESAPTEGKHSGPKGENLVPSDKGPIIPTMKLLQITDSPIGEGKPSASSGSSFVKVNSTAVLLDGGKIDTCDGKNISMNSTVTAENQEFVSCSG
jgi:hypothetical protein